MAILVSLFMTLAVEPAQAECLVTLASGVAHQNTPSKISLFLYSMLWSTIGISLAFCTYTKKRCFWESEKTVFMRNLLGERCATIFYYLLAGFFIFSSLFYAIAVFLFS